MSFIDLKFFIPRVLIMKLNYNGTGYINISRRSDRSLTLYLRGVNLKARGHYPGPLRLRAGYPPLNLSLAALTSSGELTTRESIF
jgi:hypothetical protein